MNHVWNIHSWWRENCFQTCDHLKNVLNASNLQTLLELNFLPLSDIRIEVWTKAPFFLYLTKEPVKGAAPLARSLCSWIIKSNKDDFSNDDSFIEESPEGTRAQSDPQAAEKRDSETDQSFMIISKAFPCCALDIRKVNLNNNLSVVSILKT